LFVIREGNLLLAFASLFVIREGNLLLAFRLAAVLFLLSS
jgi:hypothetical protein